MALNSPAVTNQGRSKMFEEEQGAIRVSACDAEGLI